MSVELLELVGPMDPDSPVTCCGMEMMRKNAVRMQLGGAALVVFLFAIGAMSTSEWAHAGADTGPLQDFEVTYSLWRVDYDGEDDVVLKRKDLDHRETWVAVEFNRATSVLVFLWSFFATVYYLGLQRSSISEGLEILIGLLGLVFAIFAWAGAGSWGNAFDENEFDHKDWDDTTPCDDGCGLTAFNGFLYFGFGFACLFVFAQEQNIRNPPQQQYTGVAPAAPQPTRNPRSASVPPQPTVQPTVRSYTPRSASQPAQPELQWNIETCTFERYNPETKQYEPDT